ncbi:hypothetical protein [Gemmobacter caeni]|nr:hypothetical protein [Gemmobacter caeni]
MKQRVRERLAELAGCPSEAETPYAQRLPLGRFFDLDPFSLETAQVIAAAEPNAWGAKRLFCNFLYGYEANLEPHYGDDDFASTEVDAQREHLRVSHIAYQKAVLAALAGDAKVHPYIYDLIKRFLDDIDDSEFQIDPSVRSAFRDALRMPRPSGKGGAKQATNIFRDLIIIDLVSDLIKTFVGLPATFSRTKSEKKGKPGNKNACDIITMVWNEEFKGRTKTRDGVPIGEIASRPLAETAVRNVWEKRNQNEFYQLWCDYRQRNPSS